MRRTLILSALLWGLTLSPAQADFFDDLGDALDKAGDAVDEAFTEDEKPKPDIQWNQPQRVQPNQGGDFFSDSSRPSAPQQFNNVPRRSNNAVKGDDAPPPRAAPPRRPVATVASLDPPAGFTAAPLPNFRPQYAPSYSSPAAMALPPKAAPPAVPIAKPAAVVDRTFTLAFSNQRVELSDALTHNNGQPKRESNALLKAVTNELKKPNYRLTLKAQAVVVEGRTSEARQRSFARAKLVQAWLEKAGVRPTQIDLKVEVAETDGVFLDVYQAQ